MATVTPNWTDASSVTTIIAPVKLSSGGAGYARGTLDLRTKFGAILYLKIGRITATVLATAVNVYVRRVLDNGATGTNLPFTHPSSPLFQSQIAVTTVTSVGTNTPPQGSAGNQTLILAAGTNYVAGDVICITDNGGTTFGRCEFKTVSKVATATLTLAEPLDYSHTTATADIVTRLADVFSPISLVGGSLYEIIFDYQVSATGGDIVVMAHAQTMDSTTVA